MATEGTIRASGNLTVDEVIEGVLLMLIQNKKISSLNQTVIVWRVSLLKIDQPKK